MELPGVREIRMRLHMTQSELAQIMDVNLRTVQYWEQKGGLSYKIYKQLWDMLPEVKEASRSAAESDASMVPLLPVTAEGGALSEYSRGVGLDECQTILAPAKNVEFAVQVRGDSMDPEYPSGSFVFVRRINEPSQISWGDTYVIDSTRGVVIKKLMPASDPSLLTCHSVNPLYPDYTMEKADLLGLYRVQVMMCFK